MKEICAHCGFVNCNKCSGAYDPRVPIEYHYRYSCNYAMRERQLLLDKANALKVEVDPKMREMINARIDQAFMQTARKHS